MTTLLNGILIGVIGGLGVLLLALLWAAFKGWQSSRRAEEDRIRRLERFEE